MQVELERVGAAGGSGRRSRLLSAVLPVAALVLVTSAALLGGSPDAQQLEPSAAAEALLIADPSALPRTAPSAAPSDPADIRAAALEALLPVHAFGLAVASVTEIQSGRETGELGGSLVAIRGFVSPDLSSPNCGYSPLVMENDFCERRMILASAPAPRVERATGGDVSLIAGARWGSHLHVQALPGIPVPDLFQAAQRGSGPVTPILVVLIGRFDDPRATPCERPRRHCGQEFVMERLAWADGDWLDRTLVLHHNVAEARIVSDPRRARAIAVREADRSEAILSATVLPLDELATVDPAAAELAVETAATLVGGAPGAFSGPVWYLRSVGRQWPDRARQLTWAVIDHESGLVLAFGPPPAG